jgi:hypothetical protein
MPFFFFMKGYFNNLLFKKTQKKPLCPQWFLKDTCDLEKKPKYLLLLTYIFVLRGAEKKNKVNSP